MLLKLDLTKSEHLFRFTGLARRKILSSRRKKAAPPPP